MHRPTQYRAPRRYAALLLGSLTIHLGLAALAEAEEPTHNYAVAPQSLSGALTDFADQSNLKLMFPAELARGIASPGVTGTLTPYQALTRLLASTGLTYRYTSPDTVTLERPDPLEDLVNEAKQPLRIAEAEKKKSPPHEADEPTILEEMTVTASPTDATSYNVLDTTTATKTDTPILETPFSIQVVPKQVLEDQQVIVLHEALKNVSGVRRGGDLDVADLFIIRGFSAGNGLRLRDGFRTSSASRVSTANIERVEVLKGAAGSLYGRIEPGGIVHYITKKPLAAPYYSVQQQFGSYDLFRTVADATGPLTADTDWLYRAIVSYDSWNSFRDELGYEAVFFAPTLTWKPTERTQFNLSLEYREVFEERLDFGIPAVGNRPAQIPISRYFGVIDRPPQTATEYLVDFNWSHQFNDDWSVRHKFAWWQYDASFESGGPFGLRADNETVDIYYTAPYPYSQETYFTELDLSGRFHTLGLKHDVLLGGEWYRNEIPFFFQGVDSQSNPDILSPINIFNPVYQRDRDVRPFVLANIPVGFFNPKNEWYAVFFQDQITLTDKIKILGGGRYDWAKSGFQSCTVGFDAGCPDIPFTETEDEAFTPRVGFNYAIQPWLMGFGSYSESFGTQTQGLALNGDFTDPQTAEQYEIGLKGEWFAGALTASATYFHLTKSNLTVPIPGDPVHVDQIGEARSQGFEFDLSGQLTDYWRIIANYAYTDAEITKDRDEFGGPRNTGNRLPAVPEHGGGLWSQFDFENGFGFGAGAYFATQREADQGNTVQLPGYVRFDAALSYKHNIGPSRVTFQVNLNNLLDKEYFEASYESDRNNIIPGAPRTVLGQIRVEF